MLANPNLKTLWSLCCLEKALGSPLPTELVIWSYGESDYHKVLRKLGRIKAGKRFREGLILKYEEGAAGNNFLHLVRQSCKQ